MTAEPIAPRRLSAAEYLARERAAETKSEYYAGEVFAMTGASLRHSLVVANLMHVLTTQLRNRDCNVVANDLRVRVPETDSYVYPDVVAFCGEPRLEDAELDTLLNPTLIIEVLSPSTADFDRGGKLEHYRTIESLAEVLILAQDRAHAEHWLRQPDGHWLFQEAGSTDAVLRLESVGCELKLTDAYHRVLAL
jgi:Uma2 family endonuclease